MPFRSRGWICNRHWYQYYHLSRLFFPKYEPNKYNVVFAPIALVDTQKGTIYTNFTGKLLDAYLGNQYILILYRYYSNAMLAWSMKNKTILNTRALIIDSMLNWNQNYSHQILTPLTKNLQISQENYHQHWCQIPISQTVQPSCKYIITCYPYIQKSIYCLPVFNWSVIFNGNSLSCLRASDTNLESVMMIATTATVICLCQNLGQIWF